MVLQESVTKISRRVSLHRWVLAIRNGSRRRQTETAGAHQWEKTVVSSRQRGMKPQQKNTVGRKSKQHPYHPHPKLSSVQSAVGCAHQKSDSTATNERAKIDHQLSQKSPSAKNEPTYWSLSLLHISFNWFLSFTVHHEPFMFFVIVVDWLLVCLLVCDNGCLYVLTNDSPFSTFGFYLGVLD